MRGEVEPLGRRSWDKTAPVVMVFGCVLMLVAAVLSIAALRQIAEVKRNTDEIRQQARELTIAELAQCRRVQRLREHVNTSNEIVFRVLNEASKSAANSDVSKAYAEFASRVQYLPSTNCELAVSRPSTYKPAEPYPMSVYIDKLDKRRKARK